MSKTRNKRIFACDFETTVYEDQERTDVWAAGICELFTDKCLVLGCIDEFYALFSKLKQDVILYFHNLKFDGSFIIDYLLKTKQFKQAYKSEVDIMTGKERVASTKTKEMRPRTFKYLISGKGQWYTITIKTEHNKVIEIRDSLKLLPFSLREISKGFSTKHKKLNMVYEGYRYPNCPISSEELEYIKNDVFVLKEALEIMQEDGHTKLTIGSCCMKEYKKIVHTNTWFKYDEFFPDLYKVPISQNLYKQDNAGDYIRKSYRGAWTYLVPEKANKVYKNGMTLDVNSLYPSEMHSSGGRIYPHGLPNFWCGNYIPDKAIGTNKFFFIRIKTAFNIKDGYLPTIQIKNDLLYNPREFLRTSYIVDNITGDVYTHSSTGEHLRVELTLTMTVY